MLSTLLLNNIHLSVELLGAVVFIIIGWLFAEALRIKKDIWSFGRFFGFSLLAVWQILHAIYGAEAGSVSAAAYVYLAGLAIVFLSYLEKLPLRPGNHRFSNLTYGLAIAPLAFAALNTALLFATAFVLFKRFTKDIDKLLKRLMLGFAFLALASLVSHFAREPFGSLWIAEHVLKIAGFASLAVWAWQWLTLRIKEEVLIVFIAASLFIALIVTTAFSTIFINRLGTETKNSLTSSAKVLNFFIENLKNKALAASQIVSSNADFASAVKAGDIGDLTKIGTELLEETGGQFLVVAKKNGVINFKLNAALATGENVLAERIGADALEGRPAATIDQSAEGFSVRAAAPIFYRGAIIGAVILGTRLDQKFAEDFKGVSNFETIVFDGEKISAATLPISEEELLRHRRTRLWREKSGLEEWLSSGGEGIETIKVHGEEIVGTILTLENIERKTVGALLITTTPGSLIQESQRSNRLTLLVAIIIIFSLVIPLYRFAVFLAS